MAGKSDRRRARSRGRRLLFAAAACVFSGNGLLTTLVSVRATQEGFGDFAIGLVGGGFFLGAAAGARRSRRA
ncbi:MAG: hypothetical protein EA355_00310 [Rhodobacteraceae bacterium]|nr:MAG: hypothetical protein EA355_00310 [Paracoccaceae bacterium]